MGIRLDVARTLAACRGDVRARNISVCRWTPTRDLCALAEFHYAAGRVGPGLLANPACQPGMCRRPHRIRQQAGLLHGIYARSPNFITPLDM